MPYTPLFRSCPNNYGAGYTDRGEVFCGCSSLKTITVPEGVTTLMADVFKNCGQFTEIRLPSTLTIIGAYSMAGCTGLTEMTVPATVTELREGAFKNCTGLRTVVLPDGLKELYAYVFSGCTGLKKITLPDSVTTMGFRVFENCTGLTSVNYPVSLTSCPNNYGAGYSDRGELFCGCSSLRKIVIPEGVRTIVPYSLRYMQKVETVVLPNSVTSLGANAFADCSGLEKIWIPATVTAIEKSTFSNHGDLTIHGEAGSYAEQYANENGIPFSTEQTHAGKEVLSGYVRDGSGRAIAGAEVSVLLVSTNRIEDRRSRRRIQTQGAESGLRGGRRTGGGLCRRRDL